MRDGDYGEIAWIKRASRVWAFCVWEKRLPRKNNRECATRLLGFPRKSVISLPARLAQLAREGVSYALSGWREGLIFAREVG